MTVSRALLPVLGWIPVGMPRPLSVTVTHGVLKSISTSTAGRGNQVWAGASGGLGRPTFTGKSEGRTGRCVAALDLVHGVVHNLVDEVVQAIDARAPDVHARPPPHSIKPLKNSDLVRLVLRRSRHRRGHTVPPCRRATSADAIIAVA